jgi:2-polyprenyl-3-methyl-5-hydroxy-6-metoxy-1,4-benzoquinol methylase
VAAQIRLNCRFASVHLTEASNAGGNAGAVALFSAQQPYDLAAEIKHTEQMAWGDSQTGIQLNAYKQRLYRTSLKLLSASHLPAPARLLDVGCAYGGFMQAAQQCGYQVCGYDIVPTAVSYVRSLGLEAYQCPSAAAFSERVKQPFDGVACLDVNCYWHDQRSELAHHQICAFIRAAIY